MSTPSSSSSESETSSPSSESESESSDSESTSDSDDSLLSLRKAEPPNRERAPVQAKPDPYVALCADLVSFNNDILVRHSFLLGMVNHKHDHGIYDDD